MLHFEGGCICRYNDQFVINQIDRCCTDPITNPFKAKVGDKSRWTQSLPDTQIKS